MYADAKRYREDRKAKAHRLAEGDPHQRVDSSDWSEAEPLDADAKTGLLPISRRQYKRGGMVMGAREKQRADRKPRKDGGRSHAADIAIELANQNQKDANQDRPGTKHVGGMKTGGRAHRDMGGINAGVPTTRFNLSGGTSQLARGAGLAAKTGGRIGRASGGSAHGDEAADRKLVKSMVKTGSIKGHPDNCKCERCMGGRAEKCGGGSSYKTGGRTKRAGGGPLLGPFSGLIPMLLANGSDKDDQSNMKTPQGLSIATAKSKGGEADAHWIKGAVKHPGALHRELHVPQGEKIPAKKLAKAEHSTNKLVAKRAHLAETLRSMNRSERKNGGRTKSGKMNVNIIIAPGGEKSAGMPMGAGPPPGMPPHPIVPPQMPPPGAGAMPPPGIGGPPPMGAMPSGAPPMMPRKRGGKVEAGAGSGLGRLAKMRDYGDNARADAKHY